MRHVMIKIQLYLRKLLIQAFKISLQMTIGITRLKWYMCKQITIQLVVGMLLSKKPAFQNTGWSNRGFENFLGSYPIKLY